MIDKEKRVKASELLEGISRGLTNWQLEDQWPNSETDPAFNCILRWLWNLYDDGKEEVLIDLLSNEDQKVLNNCIQFLKTNQEIPIREISLEEDKQLKKKLGKEWRTDCSSPETNENWPFPN